MKNPLIVITLVVGLAVGFGLGYLQSGGEGGGGDSPRIAELESQIEKAKQFFPTTPEMFSVGGTVKEVKKNSIVVETFGSGNPFEELPLIREVVVGDDTVIIKQEPKDSEAFQAEQEEYQEAFEKAQQATSGPGADPAALASSVEFPTPPNFFEEIEIELDELEVGSQITAESGGVNIKTAESFEATRIVVQIGPAAGPAALPAPAPDLAPVPAPIP